MAISNEQEELNDLMSQLGEFGPYQWKQHCLHTVAWLLTGIHMMSFVFVFPLLEHRCYIPEIDGPNTNTTTLLPPSQIDNYIPRNSKGHLESCLKYEEFNGSTTTSCNQHYVYNSSYFQSSRVTEWNTVCDRGWMRALLQSIFLFGTFTGALVCGIISDKYGRKPIYCISGLFQCLCGVVGSYIDNYVAFAISMFWYGVFGGSGSIVPAVALTMEIVGASKRNFCGTMFTVWFNMGALIVVGWAYFLPSWINLSAKNLQVIYGAHSALLFLHWWLMDESICWLWTHGKKKRALQIAEKAVKSNGKNFIHRYHETNLRNSVETPDAPEHPPHGALDLFKYPKLRQRSLVMLYCWFASSLTYFGLSFNSVNLSGNPYLMFVIITLVEMPAHLISIFVVPKTGNKPMFFVSLLITGVSCVVVALLPIGTVSICITMFAKITATISFDIINSYTAELFPTTLRNTAIGLCIMAARMGASIVPEINLLSSAGEEIPSITFGTTGILAAFFVLFLLPETMDRHIPQTIEDVENSKEETAPNMEMLSICC